MKLRPTLVVLTVLLPAVLVLVINLGVKAADNSLVASVEKKIEHIQQNATLEHPDEKPTEFTEQEINVYIASGRVKLPQGVQSVRFTGEPDLVTGNARVDFDELKAGRSSSNPLLSVFSGVHDVVVVAHARGMNHQGHVQVESVSLDGVEIPRFALQLFIEKYLQPKYPNIGMTSQFALPAKIDTAIVGQHKLTVSQK
ncbi:MAG: hypothetical protein DMG68_00585 [Acidobacteria bacterium]|jgi:hypothetical protein|nr:MAG: hypothetical protein DMG68_00585 [Acidobacteriota bacterium]